MATTEQYLNSLIQDKTNLINAIKEKGVEVDDNATFTQLPSKVSEISGGGTYSKWSGANGQLVGSFSHTFNLSDTNFVVGSTVSTSSTLIKSSINDFFNTEPILTKDKDYIVVQTVIVKPKYNENATYKNQLNNTMCCHIAMLTMERSDFANVTPLRVVHSLTSTYTNYFNTTGKYSTVASNLYGAYANLSAPTVQTYSANREFSYIRITSPGLYVRANNTYSLPANMSNMIDCDFDWKIEIYSVDLGTCLYGSMLNSLNSLYDEAEKTYIINPICEMGTIDNNGTLSSSSSTCRTINHVYAGEKESVTITTSGTGKSRVYCYDENKNFMENWYTEDGESYSYKNVTNGGLFTIPEGCYYIKIRFSSTSVGTITLEW